MRRIMTFSNHAKLAYFGENRPLIKEVYPRLTASQVEQQLEREWHWLCRDSNRSTDLAHYQKKGAWMVEVTWRLRDGGRPLVTYHPLLPTIPEGVTRPEDIMTEEEAAAIIYDMGREH